MLHMLQVLVSLLALFVIAITMLMSASDLKLKGARWNVRRVGFICAGVGAVGLMLAIMFAGLRPALHQTALHFGIALVMLTDPFRIPWHEWIWKGDHGGIA